MLVLTRKLQEQIAIGQDITITVLRLKGNTVRIGIEAPDSVRVVRGELPRHDTPRTAVSDSAHSKRPAANLERVNGTGPRHASPDKRSKATGLKPMVERVGQRCRAAQPVMLSVTATTTAAVLAD